MREKAQSALKRRQLAYQSLFLGHGPATDAVLADLAKFCRASISTFHADARIAAMLDGRREVWCRIAQHLHLDEESLWSLYGNHALPPERQPEE